MPVHLSAPLRAQSPGLPGSCPLVPGEGWQPAGVTFCVHPTVDLVPEPIPAVVRPLFGVANVSACEIDQGVIDGTVNGAGVLVAATSGLWRRVQTGNIQLYLTALFAGVIVIAAVFAGQVR